MIKTSQKIRANNGIIILSFLGIATVIATVVGWLTVEQIIPLKLTLNYSDWQLRLIQLWFNIAIVGGIILPLIVLFMGIRQRQLRHFLIGYFLVLIIQIASEASFSRWFCQSIVVTIGTIYTIFWIGQFWETQKRLPAQYKHLRNLVRIILLFWFANFIVLVTVAWLSIL